MTWTSQLQNFIKGKEESQLKNKLSNSRGDKHLNCKIFLPNVLVEEYILTPYNEFWMMMGGEERTHSTSESECESPYGGELEAICWDLTELNQEKIPIHPHDSTISKLLNLWLTSEWTVHALNSYKEDPKTRSKMNKHALKYQYITNSI